MNRTDIDRVLVALRPGLAGLPPAAYTGRVLAERFGAKLTLTSTIYDSALAMRVRRGARGADDARRGMMDAERAGLERLACSLRDWGIEVDIDVRWRQPAYEGALEAADACAADLIVVDLLDRHPAAHTRLIDADWQLMRLSSRPVLYVNDPDFPTYQTILAAVDPLHEGPWADETDREVLARAAAFARAFGSELRIVHAYPEAARYGWLSSVEVRPGVFFDVEQLEEAHRRAVLALVAEAGVPAEAVDLRAGSPSDVILRTAAERNARLIVLGALERGRLEQALLGSTAEAVGAEAECDVLLVKAPRQPRPSAEAGNEARPRSLAR